MDEALSELRRCSSGTGSGSGSSSGSRSSSGSGSAGRHEQETGPLSSQPAKGPPNTGGGGSLCPYQSVAPGPAWHVG